MIDIIVPVLGRPQNVRPLVDSIKENIVVEHRIIFLCSQGDDDEISEANITPEIDIVATSTFPAGPGDYAKKINAAFRSTKSPFIFTAADDVTFTPGWDTHILAVAERTGAGMVGSNDDANPLVKRGRHSTHSLFSRAYIDKVGGTFFDGPGVVYHEGYDHQWIDTEAVKAAMDRREWAFARRSVVKHHHPMYDRSVSMDDTYRRALGDARSDQALYRARLQEWARSRR